MPYTEEQLNLISKALNFTADAIGILNTSGKLVYYNSALKKIVANPVAFTTHYWKKTFEKNPAIAQVFFDNLLNGKPWEKEIVVFDQRVQHKKFFFLTVNAIKSSNGEIIGYVWVLKDIHESKAMQKQLIKLNTALEQQVTEKTTELLESNKILRKKLDEIEILNEQLQNMNELLQENSKLFVNGPVVVFKWINENGWPIEYVSPNVETVLGYKPEDLRNKQAYLHIIHKDDVERLTEESLLNQSNTNKEMSQKIYRLITKNGQEKRILDYTNYIRDKEGNITHFIGYVIDITERKEKERRNV